MKGFIIVILAIIAALLVAGGVVGYKMLGEVMDDSGSDDSTIGKIADKVSNVASSGSSDDGNIVSEVVKFNQQNGEGYYKEVTYSDGGFRQYDTESGELIGSSYDSDQDKLPSME